MKWPCLRCWGRGYVTRWEPVPETELPEWQIAELMVNGGIACLPREEPCPECSSTATK